MEDLQNDLVLNMVSMLGCEPNAAKYFLEAANWEPDMAISNYFAR